MSEQATEIFGFPTAPAVKLGQALLELRTASDGRIMGEASMLREMTGLLPVVEQVQAGTAGDSLQGLAAVRTQTASFIPRIAPYAELLAEFDNPRETFVHEIGRVRDDVLSVAAEWREEFGAADVADGTTKVINHLIEDPEDEVRRLPLLSAVISARKRRPKPLKFPPAVIIGVVAPEILTMLDAPLPEDKQKPDVIESVRSRPVTPLVTIPANLFKGRELQALRAAVPVLLPSVRDLLPTAGAEVTERFEAVKEFLEEGAAA